MIVCKRIVLIFLSYLIIVKISLSRIVPWENTDGMRGNREDGCHASLQPPASELERSAGAKSTPWPSIGSHPATGLSAREGYIIVFSEKGPAQWGAGSSPYFGRQAGCLRSQEAFSPPSIGSMRSIRSHPATGLSARESTRIVFPRRSRAAKGPARSALLSLPTNHYSLTTSPITPPRARNGCGSWCRRRARRPAGAGAGCRCWDSAALPGRRNRPRNARRAAPARWPTGFCRCG